ncbi:MAG: SAM-dependent methyltransferase [Stappia sp.]|uniref:class I SAM-dependent DNA methyltransferase n=1 Tax=Stappia sp. TaxID=1870903 RepID=UPI000C6BC154|nr:class I SAM-dependent methyltransferase [Stappia sp.]MAB01148.1 SAM-dependent methyltransferase [Stappia sp.]MBM19848.1 SAM-dependent methyltransferase [Stappia sp.]
MESDNPLLKRAYALDGDAGRIRDLYADWAASYDADTLDGMGYVAPVLAARALSEALEGETAEARILDAGCGTGLVGAEIARRTEAEIDGIDLSPGMLEEAARKKVYRSLAEADMTATLNLSDNSYDGVVSVGVFTSGHVGPEAIDELARVARPGAPLVVTVHEKVWEPDRYAAHLAEMERHGLIRLRAINDAPYHEKEGYTCKLCLLEAA